MLLTTSSCSESLKLLLQVLLFILLMEPISLSWQPWLHELWSGPGSENPLRTCYLTMALFESTASLQKHFLCTGLFACMRGLFRKSFLLLHKFACMSVQVMKYFVTDRFLVKCWAFSICAVLPNTRSKCFEVVYGEKNTINVKEDNLKLCRISGWKCSFKNHSLCAEIYCSELLYYCHLVNWLKVSFVETCMLYV